MGRPVLERLSNEDLEKRTQQQKQRYENIIRMADHMFGGRISATYDRDLEACVIPDLFGFEVIYKTDLGTGYDCCRIVIKHNDKIVLSFAYDTKYVPDRIVPGQRERVHEIHPEAYTPGPWETDFNKVLKRGYGLLSEYLKPKKEAEKKAEESERQKRLREIKRTNLKIKAREVGLGGMDTPSWLEESYGKKKKVIKA